MESTRKRLLTPPFIIVAALVLWLWEWLWDPLERVMAKIGHWPLDGVFSANHRVLPAIP